MMVRAKRSVTDNARAVRPRGCAVPEPSRTMNEPLEDYLHKPKMRCIII